MGLHLFKITQNTDYAGAETEIFVYNLCKCIEFFSLYFENFSFVNFWT
jgi:hypothetical protein